MYLESLFNGHKIITSCCYRITRNGDLSIDEDEADDLLHSIEESIKQRKWGTAVRLEIENGASEELISILEQELDITKEEEYRINGPLDLTFLMKLSGLKGFENLKFPLIESTLPKELVETPDIFEAISKQDIILHHPYYSFNPIVELVQRGLKSQGVM